MEEHDHDTDCHHECDANVLATNGAVLALTAYRERMNHCQNCLRNPVLGMQVKAVRTQRGTGITSC